MTERPIIFSAEMVRAILAGRKSMTRRTVKPQPEGWVSRLGFTCFTPPGHISGRGTFEDKGPAEKFFRMPWEHGGCLWVREGTWKCRDTGAVVGYTADYASASFVHNHTVRKCPSIHMPRAASRITLEVSDVRVERLNDISRGDAMDEGCPFPNMAKGDDPRQWFAGLWQSIHGPGSWEANPFVWCISFRRVTT